MTPPQSGWLCPCCLVVYAPSVMKCECRKAKEVRQEPVKTAPSREEYEGMRKEMSRARATTMKFPFDLGNVRWSSTRLAP